MEDNTNAVLRELERKMPEILNAMGMELYKSIYDQMTNDDVVDTGRLRGSISFSTPYNNYNNPTSVNKPEDFIKNVKDKDTVTYGSNVEYASYVNNGTNRQRARRFMQIGTSRALPKCKRVAEKILGE